MQLIAQHQPTTQSTPLPSLFSSLDTWVSDPVLSFSSLISSRKLRASTKTVYASMFKRFVEFLFEKGTDILHCNQNDVVAFFETVNPNIATKRQTIAKSRIRKVYLRLLDQTYRHLSTLGWNGDSPVRRFDPAYFGSNNKLRTLSPTEETALISHIKTRLEKLRNDKSKFDSLGKNHRDYEAYWVAVRNLAVVSLFLGGGVKVGEIGGCANNCVDLVTGVLDLSRVGKAHRCRLAPWCIPVLAFWIGLAPSVQPVSGNSPLFFARKHGFGKFSKNTTPSSETIHRFTHDLMRQAGILDARACAQTLRNTYAANLLLSGASSDELAISLGLADVRSFIHALQKSRPDLFTPKESA
jgi:integrase